MKEIGEVLRNRTQLHVIVKDMPQCAPTHCLTLSAHAEPTSKGQTLPDMCNIGW